MNVPPASLRLLVAMLAAEERDDLDEAELVYEPGAGWWAGCERASATAAWRLVGLCLVSASHQNGERLERYVLNEHGREAARTGIVPPALAEVLARAADR